jgi:hypothetical protein
MFSSKNRYLIRIKNPYTFKLVNCKIKEKYSKKSERLGGKEKCVDVLFALYKLVIELE